MAIPLRIILRRALSDTRAFWGWNVRSVLAALTLPLGAIFHGIQAGAWAPVKDELLIASLYTLAPFGLFTIALFIWNVVAAPYRIERDSRRALEAQLSPFLESAKSTERFVALSSHLKLWEAACILAGEEMRKDVTVGIPSRHVAALRQIITGERPDPAGVLTGLRRITELVPVKALSIDGRTLHPRPGQRQHLLSNDTEITKDALIAYAFSQGLTLPWLKKG